MLAALICATGLGEAIAASPAGATGLGPAGDSAYPVSAAGLEEPEDGTGGSDVPKEAFGKVNESPRPADEPAIPDTPLETISDLPRRSRLALFSAQGKREEADFGEAARILEEFLEEHPDEDHYLIRFHLANSLVQADRPEEALSHYQAAMELEGRFMQGWLNLGELAYNLGRYTLAAESILKGYDLNPERPAHLLYHAAAAYVMGEKPELAAPILKELLSRAHGEPKLEWYRAFITACLQLEDGPRGEAAVDSMLGVYSSDANAWLFAYQYYAATGDFKKAAIALTVTGYLRPLSREEQIQLGNLYAAIEVPYAASVHYESAIGDSASLADFEMLASAHLAAHDTQAALQTLNRALERQPSARLWSLLGDLYYMEENYEASMDAFRNCSELDEKHARSYLMMGYCALELGEVQEAVTQFELAANFPDQEEKARRLIERVKYMQQ
jgi:tetratricopeptide (TPR) repeat protein